MEKYGRWSDRRTGVNPFLPPKGASVSVLVTIFRYTLGIPLALLRILLFGLVSLIYFGVYEGLRVLPNIPFVSRFLVRITDIFFARLLLFLLGFLWISDTCVNTKKRAAVAPYPTITHGDLIMSNRISYAELLYLQYQYSPIFATVPNYFESEEEEERYREDQKFGGQGNVGNGLDGMLYVLGLFTLWSETISVPRRSPPNSQEKTSWTQINSLLESAKSSRKGPVVLFPEGTTTNGKAILLAPKILDTNSKTPMIASNTHVVGFKASDQVLYIGFEGFLSHLFFLCQNFSSTLEPVFVTPSCVPSSPRGGDSSSWETWEQEVEGALALSLRVPKIALSASDKISFLEYWKENH